jgi:lysozyme family protein
VDTERLIERARVNERKVKKAVLSAKKLAEEWQAKVNETHEEAQRMRREAIRPHNINFDSAARPKPLATPKDNMKMAAELLAKSN